MYGDGMQLFFSAKPIRETLRTCCSLNMTPDDILSEHELMNGKDNPRNMTQEEHSHNTAQYKGKIGFSSPGFASSFMGTPAVILDF